MNMTLEGTWDDPNNSYNDCWGYVDKLGNEYAIIGSRSKIHFVDISTPSAPVYLEGFSGANLGISGANTTWRDIKTYENFAYAVADGANVQEGLMIFDLSKLPGGNITKCYQDNTRFKAAHNIYIDVPNGRLYVLGSNTVNNGVIVYDIKSNPADPIYLGGPNVSGGYIHDAFVFNDTMYASSGNDGLYLLDFTNPTNPSLINNNNTPSNGYNHSGWFYDNSNKYIIAEEVPFGLKLTVMDISNPNSISFISDFRHPLISGSGQSVTYHNPFMIDDYAIISSYEDGVTIIDVSNPNSTSLEAYYDTYPNTSYAGYNGCWGVYPFFPSQTIIGSDISTGLYVLSTELTLNNTCGNGIKDGFELDVDCGGFCAACECEAPSDVYVSNVSSTSTTFTWSPVVGAIDYDFRYRPAGTSNWTLASNLSQTNFSLAVSNGTLYEFQIRSNCNNGRTTGYSAIHDFIAGDGCLAHQNYSGVQTGRSYSAQLSITSSAFVNGQKVKYFASDSICLVADFEVPLNTEFETIMSGCNPFAPAVPNNSFVVPSENPQEGQSFEQFTYQAESKTLNIELYREKETIEDLRISNENGQLIKKLKKQKLHAGWNWIKVNLQNDPKFENSKAFKLSN